MDTSVKYLVSALTKTNLSKTKKKISKPRPLQIKTTLHTKISIYIKIIIYKHLLCPMVFNSKNHINLKF